MTLLRLSLQLTPSEDAPAIARRQVVERFAVALERRELEEARLLTSELVTNAVVHGSGRVELSALLDDDRLMIEVADQGDGFERAVREHGLDAVGGNGLNIVDAIASRWGIHRGSSHVWFELERAGPHWSRRQPRQLDRGSRTNRSRPPDTPLNQPNG